MVVKHKTFNQIFQTSNLGAQEPKMWRLYEQHWSESGVVEMPD